jgi:hypothetical protein
MTILYLGEIVGKPGRNALKKALPGMLKKYKPDFVFANAENLTHGKGVSKKHLTEMMVLGIDYFTTGDHIWDREEFVSELDDPAVPVLRPANIRGDKPGRGYAVIKKNNREVLLINLQGKTFMNDQSVDSPFEIGRKILQDKKEDQIAIVDFHAEATSEKIALSYYLEKYLNIFLGSHTHVPTADTQIRNGMAYVTDIGMIGPNESVIGVKKEIIIEKFLTGKPRIHDIATGDAILNAIIVDIDDKSNKSTKIVGIHKIIKL